MKKLAIFQSDLRVGGIQKALVNVLNEIDYSECQVDLFLFDSEKFFELAEHENLNIYFKKPMPFLNRLVYFRPLRWLCKGQWENMEYDVAVDFNSYRNECAIGACSVKAKKRVMWLHNDIEIKLKNEPKYKVLWHFFKKKLSWFDEFCAVSPGIIDGFRRTSGIFDKAVTPIPNHIDTAEIFSKMEEPIALEVDDGVYNFCTMGRICHQKGFDILMDYLAELRERRRDFHLYLLGDGPDRTKLERYIEKLNLGSYVTLLGNQPNPFPYLKKMDGFVLTSRYEGQGLVIWEAKAVGLELFITENLEKYNPGIAGCKDLVSAMENAVRKEKQPDALTEYNSEIGSSIRRVLEL